MSDVVPSFFPTPHEIAGGIRWMREHPVVATAAAAAATAVSVITYLKSRAEEEHLLRKSVSHEDSSDGDADANPPQRERFSTWSGNYDLQPSSSSSAASQLKHVVKKSKSSDDFRMASSSTHHRKDTADDMYSSTESEMSTSSPTVRRSNPSSLSFGDLDAESSVRGETMLEAPTSVGKSSFQFGFPGNHAVIEEEDEENPSMSPQWGWYVSTTPPDEYYA